MHGELVTVGVLGYTHRGSVIFLAGVIGAFAIGLLVNMIRLSWKLRVIVVCGGPLVIFVLVSWYAGKEQCTRECVDAAALVSIGLMAVVAWLIGSTSGYLLSRVIRTSQGDSARYRT